MNQQQVFKQAKKWLKSLPMDSFEWSYSTTIGKCSIEVSSYSYWTEYQWCFSITHPAFGKLAEWIYLRPLPFVIDAAINDID